jgi:hypothetical protein
MTKGQIRYLKSQQTARAAESLVEAELHSRHYRTIFLGTHHPIADFRVMSPQGCEF